MGIRYDIDTRHTVRLYGSVSGVHDHGYQQPRGKRYGTERGPRVNSSIASLIDAINGRMERKDADGETVPPKVYLSSSELDSLPEILL